MRTLYGSSISPFVRKVIAVLEEKKLPYELKQVRPRSKEQPFASLSPLGKIPAYQDEHIGVSDSSVICAYLEKAHPSPALYPQHAADLARALWFEEFFDSALFLPLGTMFLEGFMKPKLRGQATDADAERDAREIELPPLLAYAESQVSPDRWLVGQEFSIADISMGVGFMNMDYIGYQLDTGRYPNLADYLKRVHARPSLQTGAKAMRDFISQLMSK